MARPSWKRLCAASLFIAAASAVAISSGSKTEAQAAAEPQYQAALPYGDVIYTNPINSEPEPSKPKPTKKPNQTKPTKKPSQTKPPQQVETSNPSKPPTSSDPKPNPDPKPEPNPDAGISRASLWKPSVRDSWQIALRNPVNMKQPKLEPDVKIWDIDAYENSKEIIEAIQKQGKKVICYFSAGTYENYREDKGMFKPEDLGKTLDGWPDERWVKLGSQNVRNIMAKRIRTAASKGCDALDPDNVDAYVSLSPSERFILWVV